MLKTNDFYGEVLARKDDIHARFLELTGRSGELFKRAGSVMPGGYTRDAIMRAPYAPFVKSGKDAFITDADDRVIQDLWFNATSLPLGHADDDVVTAICEQAGKGTAYYGPTEVELDLADEILARLPRAEMIRFANSGSEAVMLAIRFARAFRGRSLVVKFEGSYHGSYDDVSWSVAPAIAAAGEEASPSPVPESGGLAGHDGRLAVLPYNDPERLTEFVERHHEQIAGILVEPMANRIGLLFPTVEFVQRARQLCDKYGIVLLFDEVIAFRVGHSGAQGALGVTPDLTMLGKIIGGGFPVGAIVGRADILSRSAPGQEERVTHAGTFNANPMSMSAGLATLRQLTPTCFAALSEMGEYVRRQLRAITDGLPIQITGEGSLFKITPTSRPIRNYRDAATTDKRWEQLVSLALYNEGFLLTPMLSGVVSTKTKKADVDGFLAAFRQVIRV